MIQTSNESYGTDAFIEGSNPPKNKCVWCGKLFLKRPSYYRKNMRVGSHYYEGKPFYLITEVFEEGEGD